MTPRTARCRAAAHSRAMPHRRYLTALVVVIVAGAPSIAATSTTTVRTPRPCSTAIALRDRVPDEQMLGTKAFTVPLLLGTYPEYRYLEASDDDNGRARLVAALAEARAAHDGEGCSVDLFLLAHGDDFASWVEAIPPDQVPPLRLVYDTGAGDAAQGPRWLALGARSFVGHPGGNLAPVFYAYLLPAWLQGEPLGDIVASANRRTFATIMAARPYLGDDTGPLWRGTRAQLFGDIATRKR